MTFLLSPGFLHTIKYYLKNDPAPSQLKGNEEAEELRKYITCVDDLQIILQDKSALLKAEKDVDNALRILEDIKNNKIKIDSTKVASKYIEYMKRKEKNNEKPLSSGDWLWHTIDLLNLGELLKE